MVPTGVRLTWPGATVALAVDGPVARVDVAVRWGTRLLVVRDEEVAAPRRGTLDVRGPGLWLSLVCETPGEHWTIGMEAFALAVEHPDDERGDLVPLGLDIEWEAPGRIHGELLVGDERTELDEAGELDVS